MVLVSWRHTHAIYEQYLGWSGRFKKPTLGGNASSVKSMKLQPMRIICLSFNSKYCCKKTLLKEAVLCNIRWLWNANEQGLQQFEAFLMMALLGLAARLRCRANTGKGPSLSLSLSGEGLYIQAGSVMGLLPGGFFLSLPVPTHWSVRLFNNLAPVLQSFHLLDKSSDQASTQNPKCYSLVPLSPPHQLCSLCLFKTGFVTENVRFACIELILGYLTSDRPINLFQYYWHRPINMFDSPINKFRCLLNLLTALSINEKTNLIKKKKKVLILHKHYEKMHLILRKFMYTSLT